MPSRDTTATGGSGGMIGAGDGDDGGGEEEDPTALEPPPPPSAASARAGPDGGDDGGGVWDDGAVNLVLMRRRASLETTRREASADFWDTFAGVAGNVLEWYDFAIFGYLGDVIGEVFFPPDQGGDKATIESFAVFGGAFLMRPLGGALFGYVGDTLGRRKALTVSIFLMAFPTFAMGCLPSYGQVGSWAIVLLTIVRLLQGLSVGGQLMSSLVFTLENHPKARWGLYGSYVMASANFGTLLGGIVGYVLRASLTHQQLVDWGWRIPFLSGILVSACGFYLRSHGDEGHGGHATGAYDVAGDEDRGRPTAITRRPRVRRGHTAVPTTSDDSAEQELGANGEVDSGGGDEAGGEIEHAPEVTPEAGSSASGAEASAADATDAIEGERRNPIAAAFSRGNRRSLAAAAMVPTLWSGGFYLCFVWMAIYQAELIPVPVPHAFGVNSGALLISVCLFFPFAGTLSDRLGRRLVMVVGGASMMVLSPVLVMLIGRGSAPLALVSQSLLGIALSFWGAPMCAWLVEAFEPEARLTSVAIGYNIAQATVGGAAPSVATVMVDTIGPESPGWFLTVVAAVALAGLLWVAPPAPASAAAQVAAGSSPNFSSLPPSDGGATAGEEDGVAARGPPSSFEIDSYENEII